MTELTAEAWADALELYQYSYTSVSVVRREHEEWWLDAAAIMRGQTSDPRGWRSLDPDEDEDERRDDPLFPFAEAPTTPEDVVRFRQRVTELPGARSSRWSSCSAFPAWRWPRRLISDVTGPKWNAERV